MGMLTACDKPKIQDHLERKVAVVKTKAEGVKKEAKEFNDKVAEKIPEPIKVVISNNPDFNEMKERYEMAKDLKELITDGDSYGKEETKEDIL